MGLLHRRRFCCDKEMNVCTPKAGENWGHWRCSRCRKTKGYLTGTFFAGTHLTLKDVFRLSFYWRFQQWTYELMKFEQVQASFPEILRHYRRDNDHDAETSTLTSKRSEYAHRTSPSDLAVFVNSNMLITKIIIIFPNSACVSSTLASKFEFIERL